MENTAQTVDIHEINKFSNQASEWWDELGPFKPLHQMNPVRIGYIRDTIVNHFGLEGGSLGGVNIMDVGCGGGILCEPLARLGAQVTGVDASSEAVKVANSHSSAQGLDITYINSSIEGLDKSLQVDVLCMMEIVEHVADLESFIELAARHVKPGGLLFFSTINKTLKSFALAKVAAEYILRLAPRGTHEWHKFVKPSEMDQYLRANNMEIKSLRGLLYNPLKGDWSLGSDLSVNYLGHGVKSHK